jgi:hypothetical protein
MRSEGWITRDQLAQVIDRPLGPLGGSTRQLVGTAGVEGDLLPGLPQLDEQIDQLLLSAVMEVSGQLTACCHDALDDPLLGGAGFGGPDLRGVPLADRQLGGAAHGGVGERQHRTSAAWHVEGRGPPGYRHQRAVSPDEPVVAEWTVSPVCRGRSIGHSAAGDTEPSGRL